MGIKVKSPAKSVKAKLAAKPKEYAVEFEIGSYEKRPGEVIPMFVINPKSRFPFQFGVGKAKLLLAEGVFDAIREFVEENDTQAE